jgi:hypothetical protein
VAHAGQQHAQDHAALVRRGVALVQHAVFEASVAGHLQEPAREGRQRLLERLLRRWQWFGAVAAPVALCRLLEGPHGNRLAPFAGFDRFGFALGRSGDSTGSGCCKLGSGGNVGMPRGIRG